MKKTYFNKPCECNHSRKINDQNQSPKRS